MVIRVRVEEVWLLSAGVWTRLCNEVQNPVPLKDRGAQLMGLRSEFVRDYCIESRAVLGELHSGFCACASQVNVSGVTHHTSSCDLCGTQTVVCREWQRHGL